VVTRKPAWLHAFRGVERTGIEPVTSGLQSERGGSRRGRAARRDTGRPGADPDGTTLFLPVDGEPEAVAPEELTNGFMYPTSPN
jgi:hypothetical protein